MQQTSLSDVGMNNDIWRQCRVDDRYFHEGVFEVPYMRRLCYEMNFEGRDVTLGVYEWKGEEILKAWGYKDEEHCSYHAIKTGGTWSGVIEGCPLFKVLLSNTTVTGFSLGDRTMYITDNANGYVQQEQSCCVATSKERTFFETLILFKPLILTVLLSFVFGIAITFFQTFSVERLIMNCMGTFITLIGLLKVRDVHKFVQMFRRYDPLAKNSIFYAKCYPYLETTLGVLILSGIFVVPVQVAVIFIYTCTSTGIIRSLNAKENLVCACLGGGVVLPLSNVTIFENFTMIAMALFTLYCY